MHSNAVAFSSSVQLQGSSARVALLPVHDEADADGSDDCPGTPRLIHNGQDEAAHSIAPGQSIMYSCIVAWQVVISMLLTDVHVAGSQNSSMMS